MRSLAVLFALAVIASACGDDSEVEIGSPSSTVSSDTTSTTGPAAPAPSDGELPVALPTLLAAGDYGVVQIIGDDFTELSDEPAEVAVGFGDGRYAAKRDSAVQLVGADGGVLTTLDFESHDFTLYEAFVADGASFVIVGVFTSDPGVEPGGDLVLIDVGTDVRTVLGPAAGPEFGVGSAQAGGELVVLSATSDLTETISFVARNGARVDRPSPTDDLEYNAPPFMSDAVLSPDGTELAWLEGPDSDGADPDPDSGRVGDWELVVADAETLTERLRVVVAPQDDDVIAMDFDGRYAVVSRHRAPGFVLDTRGEADPSELSNPDGVIRFA